MDVQVGDNQLPGPISQLLGLIDILRIVSLERHDHSHFIDFELEFGELLLLDHFAKVYLRLLGDLCELVEGVRCQFVGLIELEELRQVLDDVGLVIDLDFLSIKILNVFGAVVQICWLVLRCSALLLLQAFIIIVDTRGVALVFREILERAIRFHDDGKIPGILRESLLSLLI